MKIGKLAKLGVQLRDVMSIYSRLDKRKKSIIYFKIK
jgi:hypothetical protein